jgi:UDP-2,4-diacetamido-2,4,6-trideoxy-beta-L-altropyranose hydrolase
MNYCEYYPNYDITFVCRNFKYNISHKVVSKYKLILLDYNIEPVLDNYDTWIGKEYNDEQLDILDILKNDKYDIFIIDHYGIDHILENKAKEYCHKIIVITDLFHKIHYCDIFINYNKINNNENINMVKNILTSEHTEIRLGIENIIINPLFLNHHKSIYNDKINKIVINMGGADPNNFILQILMICKNFILTNNITIDIIIGYSNINMESIRQFIDNCNKENKENLFHIHYNISFETIINLHLEADIAIGSLSITAYERLFLKIPQITIKIVENQTIDELDVFNVCKINNVIEKLVNYNLLLKSLIL